MKRALRTLVAVTILGMAAISCDTADSLEDVMIEDTNFSTDDKDDIKEQPGTD